MKIETKFDAHINHKVWVMESNKPKEKTIEKVVITLNALNSVPSIVCHLRDTPFEYSKLYNNSLCFGSKEELLDSLR